VYLPDQFGRLHCVDAASGKSVWTYKLRGSICGSALLADGKLYVGSRNTRRFVVLAAGREKKVLHLTKFPSRVYSTPVAAKKRLYVAASRRLYCFKEAGDPE
jgi:outer membrane protein assembly factor BamB